MRISDECFERVRMYEFTDKNGVRRTFTEADTHKAISHATNFMHKQIFDRKSLRALLLLPNEKKIQTFDAIIKYCLDMELEEPSGEMSLFWTQKDTIDDAYIDYACRCLRSPVNRRGAQEETETVNEKKTTGTAHKPNQFTNYQQREIDFDALNKKVFKN